ncbi:reverse transcriptase family protein [Arthrobacter sp.]|uniref:reverse transcriptase family protein n=1 Tax=Arthrobacter sp. TaxID=1667 RepID=UPI0026DFF3AC|nr:reverse transcriptase family protein [Arthrobacter sp.]MDO5753864.1 reverse transcriptase family protein [Arthrobacter sp.]
MAKFTAGKRKEATGMTTDHKAAQVLAHTPHPTPTIVATALSHAFLAAPEWTVEALVSAGAEVLGARRRWLGPLVRAVVDAYHRKPADAPRELAAHIGASEPFAAAVDKAHDQRKPLRLAAYAVAEPELRDGTHPVPEVTGLEQLAEVLGLKLGELEWFADTRHLNRLASRSSLQHYRYMWRERPGRTPRLLEIPGLRLRNIQRKVLHGLLAPIPLHNAAHGFVPGRSASSGAALHTGADVVISMDLLCFFANVSAGKVFGALRQSGYPEAVAHRLTGLCTHIVPPRVISSMPPGGSAAERFALTQALRLPHLPQGAPTSPALANLALRRLDSRLQGWAEVAGANYTRYADDLGFSGGPALARRTERFLRGAKRIVADEGHNLNESKTRFRPRSTRQQITGIVVNQHLNAPRREFDALKAILHNCMLFGPESQNRADHTDYRAHLLGRITWMESLNPARGVRLRRDFERISW